MRETTRDRAIETDRERHVRLGLIGHPKTKVELSVDMIVVGGKPERNELLELAEAVQDALVRFGHSIVVALEGTTSTCIHGRWDTQDCQACEDRLDGCVTR
jgi:hypothetical protein